MKFPIGIQDFRELREGGYAYVDKTEYIHRFISTGKYYFFSRPRRFGKSLLLATMKELYSGSKELFKGLWIENRWDWDAQNPIIHLKFATFRYKENPLKDAIANGLKREAEELGIELSLSNFTNPLEDLIRKAYQKFGRKVVLLIDEYDKPIIDFLDDVPQAEINRDTLKYFYSVLKDADPYLELVFLTGVSAFSKVSIFSDLNNLSNITLTEAAEKLVGITQEELETHFEAPLKEIANKFQVDYPTMLEKVRRWYNGYSWTGSHKVYNPFSLLSFLSRGQFLNFWFQTGTPTFLIKELKKRAYYDINLVNATAFDLSNFDFQRLNPITVLFQTGYLTVKDYEHEDLIYTLGFPNLEVRHSLQEILLNEYLMHPPLSAVPRVVKLRNALRQKELEEVFLIINAAFADIPGELWRGKTKHFYHAVVHLIFSLLGTYIQSEVRSARGRCDALVQTDDYIYAFEFKLDKGADLALQQIKDKGYLKPYADSTKEKIAVGVDFSSEERQVVEWKVIILNQISTYLSSSRK